MKDRIAKYMIEAAEKRGNLKPGFIIVEATTGNTGIALSLAASLKGYKLVVVMPETMTIERQQMMRAYGAEVVLTPGKDSVTGSVNKAKELAKQPGWWMPAQFENSDNVVAHREFTGAEILKQVPSGRVDAFIAGVGTGGTLMGVGEALRARNPTVRLIAAQPEGSKELTGGAAGKHMIEGVADGFVPKIVDTSLINETIYVKDEDAVRTAQRLASEHGLLVGISSGANVFAAVRVARRMRKEDNVVTILPDSADRYLSLGIFEKTAEQVKVPSSCAG